MDRDEQFCTVIIKRLLEGGVIKILHYTEGKLETILNPEMMKYVRSLKDFIINLTRSNWTFDDILQAIKTKGLVSIIVEIAAGWAQENLELFVLLAIKIANFIYELFDKSRSPHRLQVPYNRYG